MTEDELFFSVEAIRDELRKERTKLRQTDAHLEVQSKTIQRLMEIKSSITDSLAHFFASPVVSISEYRSLTLGLSRTNAQLEEVQEKRTQTQKIRNQAALEIPKLEAQLVDFELRLELYEPPRTVLEFKNDKQRSKRTD